jgi:methylase of polypeptide subunit release factors
VGYAPETIEQRLHCQPMQTVDRGRLPQLLYNTRQLDPLDTTIRLFLLEQPVSSEAARRTLDKKSLQRWEAAGLIESDGETLKSVLRILPYEQLYFASDLNRSIREDGDTNFVMGLGHATELLAFAAVPGDGRDTLDLGTGCGALGVMSAATSKSVLGADINSRAVNYANFNAQLNGIDSFQAKQGDLFAPAKGRRFERIISNPPFVIAPDARYVFRDSGKRGDEFCRELVRTAPQYLASEGIFQMLANCPHIQGRNWQEDWAEWFEGNGCDVVVWANETVDISQYAATWIRDTELDDAAEIAARVERYDTWMNYFESQNFEAISYGVVTMRKRDTANNFVRIDDTSRTIRGRCGELIQSAFQVEEFLNEIANPHDLMNHKFRLSEQTQITEISGIESGQLVNQSSRIHLDHGATDTLNLDPASMMLLKKCDGNTLVKDILPLIASEFGVSIEQLTEALPPIIEHLLDRFFLSLPQN